VAEERIWTIWRSGPGDYWHITEGSLRRDPPSGYEKHYVVPAQVLAVAEAHAERLEAAIRALLSDIEEAGVEHLSPSVDDVRRLLRPLDGGRSGVGVATGRD
jgi:hypothetical protein